MSNTGLLTSRCDPYGAESTIRLLGGTLPENMAGRYHWYCAQRAEARFRFVCTGGEYGERRQPDGGLIAAYHCPGGHMGPVMPLCKRHQRELAAGPPPPGFTKSMQPYGVVGGTKANEMCPACAMPPAARTLMDEANALQEAMSQAMWLGLMSEVARLDGQQRLVRERLTEMYHTGRVHRCPLKLTEVS